LGAAISAAHLGEIGALGFQRRELLGDRQPIAHVAGADLVEIARAYLIAQAAQRSHIAADIPLPADLAAPLAAALLEVLDADELEIVGKLREECLFHTG